jgi:RNA polymerase sigma-70 factor (ECF subfamily)
MSMNAANRHSPESERLLEAARAGDNTAFGQLVERYRPYLKTVANRVLAGYLPSDGSDVVQNGLRLALERLVQFRGHEPAAFLGWLASIVRNEARRCLRQAGRLQEALPDGPAGGDVAGSSSGPDARASRREQAARLLAVVQALPEDYRMVIELRNLKGLPFEIVAERMGRSSPAVRKLWNRAMDRLREELGDEP